MSLETQINKMRYLLPVIFVLLVISCKTSEPSTGITKGGDTYETGPVLPELRIIKSDTAWIALYPYARMFYMDMKIKNSERFIKMIQTAEKKPAPVRTMIFKRPMNLGGEEIAEIIAPTAQDIKTFKAAMKK